MWRWTEIDVTLSPLLTAPRNKECLMTFIAVRCPHCQSEQIVKRGKTGCGTQRYLCQNTTCATGSFLLDYRYLGRLPEVKHQIIDMSLNASGVGDTARVLSWRMFLGAAKTQSFCSSKRCWSPSGSRVFIRIIGGRTNAISTPTCIVRANGIPRRSSASI